MNYEQKYKEALAWVESIYPEINHEHQMEAETFFSELAKSEDERIREEIIQSIKDNMVVIHKDKCLAWLEKLKVFAEHGDGLYYFGNNGFTYVCNPIWDNSSWLEKQGEQKSIWHNEDEEPQRGSLILLIMQSGTPIVAKIIEPNHTFNHGERWAYIDDLLEKQGTSYTKKDVDDAYIEGMAFAKNELEKQKLTEWSKEDEKRLNSCLNILQPKSLLGNVETINTMWLKSFKERYTWKPTDGQMKALDSVIDEYDGYPEFDSLVSLKNDLKKL